MQPNTATPLAAMEQIRRARLPVVKRGVCPVCTKEITEAHREPGRPLPRVDGKEVHIACFYEPARYRVKAA